MRKHLVTKHIFIIFVILFAFSGILSCEYQSPSDGENKLGFPFNFYTYFGGKREKPYNEYEFDIPMLLLDIIIIWCVAILISKLWGALKNRKAS